jgi:hypothetical protein
MLMPAAESFDRILDVLLRSHKSREGKGEDSEQACQHGCDGAKKLRRHGRGDGLLFLAWSVISHAV